jgi:hypothetical protein
MEEFVVCSETGVKIDKPMIIGCISDTFKSINGFRPRHIDFNAMSFTELGDYLEELQNEEEEAYKYQLEEEKRQEIWMNKILDELVVMGADNRVTAQRWLAEADQ